MNNITPTEKKNEIFLAIIIIAQPDIFNFV